MDLRELETYRGLRHPWEVARVEAVRRILAPCLWDGIRVLDMGCGDGFVSRRLFAGLEKKEVTAVDINLTAERIAELERYGGSIRYLAEPPAEGRFDLLLVMDVIEHVEDDHAFLAGVVERHAAAGGKVMITVPSFQALYGHHDVVLGHYRRYSLEQVEDVARRSALHVVGSGYLFGSLLVPKLIYNKLSGLRGGVVGVGDWHGGKVFTSIVEKLLKMDSALLVSAAGFGVKIPGLSAWALCEKRW